MPSRQTPLRNEQIYHVFNRGVAKSAIFYDRTDYQRFLDGLAYYRFVQPIVSLSLSKRNYLASVRLNRSSIQLPVLDELAEVLAFCLMPNHFHLLLRQTNEEGISTMMRTMANSYARYFNTRHERVGPLFQGRFKSQHVQSTEQLIHVSRYIHLNPVVGFVTVKPEDYLWSSYGTYLDPKKHPGISFCKPGLVLQQFSKPGSYQTFVNDHTDYARTLEIAKHAMVEE